MKFVRYGARGAERPGVGDGFRPPRYLKPGDVVELGIEGLGQQRQTVIADHASA